MNKEYDPKVFKKMKKNFENIIENPSELMDDNSYLADPNMSILDQIELNKGRGEEEEKNLKRHLFLEDLRFVCKQNKGFLDKGNKVMTEILTLISELKKKMEEFGSIFSELAMTHSDLEETKIEEIESIKPKISKIYKDLKLSFYSWGNIYNHQTKHINKLFSPVLEKLSKQNNFIIEVSLPLTLISQNRGWE